MVNYALTINNKYVLMAWNKISGKQHIQNSKIIISQFGQKIIHSGNMCKKTQKNGTGNKCQANLKNDYQSFKWNY